MVAFAGYDMPVQYQGIKDEHLHTRSLAGLFDVSHMGQIRIFGDSADTAIEKRVTSDIRGLRNGQQRYTLMTNQNGGIIDDLMVTKTPKGLHLVVNGACKETDYHYLKKTLDDSEVELCADLALLALQGPKAVDVLSALNPDIEKLTFLTTGSFQIHGIACFISRSGYTGEDGFEISLASTQAEAMARLLLSDKRVQFAGLGARDSLRLEAGLCLYGHDIDTITTPIEAGLGWVIARKYRDGAAAPSFPGAEKIMGQIKNGVGKQRCGLVMEGKLPVREGAGLFTEEQEEVGEVTSGGFGPSVNHPVAMGYVQHDYAHSGNPLQVEIRQRLHTIRITALPFMKHRYVKP